MDLAAAVERLYGDTPEEFVGGRKELAARARSSGDRRLATAILALRKPTLAAWALNATVRARPAELDEFAAFATDMRAAQARSDGPAMRDLGRDRDPLLARLQEAVADVAVDAGQPLTPAVLAEVRSTFVAALADPAAQERALSGCLIRSLTYAGLGEVDLTQATAAPPADHTRPSARERNTARERAAARRRLLDRAQDAVNDAEREVTARSLAHVEAQEKARRAEAHLAELEGLLRRTARDVERARAAQEEAATALTRAEQARESAQAELDALGD